MRKTSFDIGLLGYLLIPTRAVQHVMRLAEQVQIVCANLQRNSLCVYRLHLYLCLLGTIDLFTLLLRLVLISIFSLRLLVFVL